MVRGLIPSTNGERENKNENVQTVLRAVPGL